MAGYYWNEGSIKYTDYRQKFKYGSDNVKTVIYGDKPVYCVKYGSTTVYEWWHYVEYWAQTGSTGGGETSPSNFINSNRTYTSSNSITVNMYIINYSTNVLYMRWLRRSSNVQADANTDTSWSSRNSDQSNFTRNNYIIYPESYSGPSTYYGGQNRANRDYWSLGVYDTSSWWRSGSVVIWPIADINVLTNYGALNDANFSDFLSSKGVTPPGLLVLDFRHQYNSDSSDD